MIYTMGIFFDRVKMWGREDTPREALVILILNINTRLVCLDTFWKINIARSPKRVKAKNV